MTKGFLKPVIVAAVLLPVVYLLSVYVIGRQVQSEFERVAQELAARDDVRVTRFEYQRGFVSGTLHYDLLLAPEQTTLVPQLEALMAFVPAGGLPVAGTLVVRHGPLLGGGSIGIASADWSLPWTEGLSAMLPQADSAQALLEVAAVVKLSGVLQVDIEPADYTGDISDPDTGQTLTVEMQDLAMQISVNRYRDELGVNAAISRLLVVSNGRDAGRFDIQNLSFAGQWQQFSPYIWTGDSEFSVALFAVQSPESVVTMNDIVVDGSLSVYQGNLEMGNTISTGRLWVNDFNVNDTRLTLSAGNIDAGAYATLMAMTMTTASQMDADDMSASLQQLLSGQPWFAIDTWRVSLQTAEDIVGSMRVQLPAAASADEILPGLLIENELRISTAALREFARMYVQTTSDPTLEEPRLTQEANVFYDSSLEMLQTVPGLQVSADHISVSTVISNGVLTVSGQPVMNVSPWLNSNVLLGGAGRNAVGLDILAEPFFGRYELHAGFSPDPHQTQLIAGGAANLGSAMLDGTVTGACVGFVSADRPDLELTYSAGPDPLFIYTASDADSTIIVRDPAGNWHCNDDAPGLAYNAGVRFNQPLSGDYLIWVGTFSGAFAEAVLFVSGVGFTQ
jgi:uncharacterized protein YdgA (DUF945 family)